VVEQSSNLTGWKLLYDYVRKSPKMVKLQHIVKEKLREKELRE
jgi:hypothetical protein